MVTFKIMRPYIKKKEKKLKLKTTALKGQCTFFLGQLTSFDTKQTKFLKLFGGNTRLVDKLQFRGIMTNLKVDLQIFFFFIPDCFNKPLKQNVCSNILAKWQIKQPKPHVLQKNQYIFIAFSEREIILVLN